MDEIYSGLRTQKKVKREGLCSLIQFQRRSKYLRGLAIFSIEGEGPGLEFWENKKELTSQEKYSIFPVGLKFIIPKKVNIPDSLYYLPEI